MNSNVPHVVSLQFTATPAGKILTLPVGVVARNVLFVKCLNLNPVQKVDFYFDENSPNVVKLMGKVQNCELNWEVKIVTGHQIDGLDGADFSTIPDYCEMLMAIGTTAFALQLRNTQLAESANQETAQYQALQQNMRVFENQFQNMLHAWQSAQALIEPLLPDGPGWQLEN